MDESEFLPLSSLFDAIGVIEKGIEKIYHYLLKNVRIDNLKEVSSKFGLTLKRGYKICSVLNDLELVQIYDRPMKIHLATPVIPIWQKVINNRIEELSEEFQEKKERAENALEDFLKSYNLTEQVSQEFVEFIKYDLSNFYETYYTFTAKSECRIAIGIRYDNDLITLIKEKGPDLVPEELRDSMKNGMIKVKENVKNLNIKVIFNAELVKELLKSEDLKILAKHIDQYDLVFGKISVHVTADDFSNFGLTNTELVQPSFDPTNKLIGAYISRNSSIYQIFHEKFNELFEKGIPINDFLKENKDLGMESITEKNCFVLCLL
jgi:sugar-specific transcriptional regulator TrmB